MRIRRLVATVLAFAMGWGVAARAQAPSRLFDPRIVGIALQTGRRFGWQRVLPIALLALLTAQWARDYQTRADGNR